MKIFKFAKTLKKTGIRKKNFGENFGRNSCSENLYSFRSMHLGAQNAENLTLKRSKSEDFQISQLSWLISQRQLTKKKLCSGMGGRACQTLDTGTVAVAWQ